jgi:glycosyltransferase involved in cell wall biosynthesis
MKDNVKVLHVGPDIEARGGIASVLYGLNEHAALFAALGFDFDFLPTTAKVSTRFVDKAIVFARALFRLMHKLIRSDVDIVHIHTAIRGSLIRKSVLAWACVLTRTPYVLQVHNGAFVPNYLAQSAAVRYCIRKILSRAASVIVLSRSSWTAMIDLQLVAPNKCHIVFNGIADPLNGKSLERDESKETVIVTFLGLISAAKGVPSLISAVAAMRRDLPAFSVRLAGIGDIKGLKDSIDANKIAGTANYVGWLNGEEKAATLAATDIFVLPSRSEGFSVAIVEAMAYGVAIVSTAIPGVVDVIRDDIDGILTKPDDVPALTAALERLVQDSSERSRLGDSARQRYLDTFTFDLMTTRLAQVYEFARSELKDDDVT